MSRDTIEIPNSATSVDLALLRFYGREVPGLVELAFAQNPGLADLGTFPPPGTRFTVDTPPAAPAAGPAVVSLFD